MQRQVTSVAMIKLIAKACDISGTASSARQLASDRLDGTTSGGNQPTPGSTSDHSTATMIGSTKMRKVPATMIPPMSQRILLRRMNQNAVIAGLSRRRDRR